MLTPVGTVLRLAQALAFVREEPRNSNRGQAVEAFLKATGTAPGAPWCAAFVAWVGKTVLGTLWPLPLTAGCAALGVAGADQDIVRTTPQRGDVFLIWFPKLNRYAHTGFVVEVLADGRCRTVEGNTNDGGSRDGWGVFERTRAFGPHDRFLRWADVPGLAA